MNRRNPKFEWQTAFIQSRHTGNAGFVGMLMSSLDNGDGSGFFVSATSISRWTGLNERTVRNQIAALVESGWIVRTSTGGRRGNRARASTYELTVPDGATRSNLSARSEQVAAQPEDVAAQPEEGIPQPEPSTHAVDQSSLDHLSLDQPSLDLASLAPGEEVTGQQMRRLEETEQDLFLPSLNEGDFWVYEPELMATQADAAPHSTDPPPVLSSWDEMRQRQYHERLNSEEGLDALGEPLPKRDRSSMSNRSWG